MPHTCKSIRRRKGEQRKAKDEMFFTAKKNQQTLFIQKNMLVAG